MPPTAAGVANLYRDICSRFVYDPADQPEAAASAAASVAASAEPVPAPLLVHQSAPPEPLLAVVLGAD